MGLKEKELIDTITTAMIRKFPDENPTGIMEKVVAVSQAFHKMGLLSFKLELKPAEIVVTRLEGKL